MAIAPPHFFVAHPISGRTALQRLIGFVQLSDKNRLRTWRQAVNYARSPALFAFHPGVSRSTVFSISRRANNGFSIARLLRKRPNDNLVWKTIARRQRFWLCRIWAKRDQLQADGLPPVRESALRFMKMMLRDPRGIEPGFFRVHDPLSR